MEEGSHQDRGRAAALTALVCAGCVVAPAYPEAQRGRRDYFFVRYDILSLASPPGELKACAEPPGKVLKPGRTLLVQAAREAVVRWNDKEVRLRPFVDARGRAAIESEDGQTAAQEEGGGVLVGLGEASAFVRVEPVE